MKSLYFMKNKPTLTNPTQPATFDADERKYVRRGVIFAILVMMIAGNVYYDDVYNDGMSSSVKSKIQYFLRKRKTKPAKATTPPAETILETTTPAEPVILQKTETLQTEEINQ